MADLSYYSGRPFMKLEEGENGEWTIYLDGDATITNKDPEISLPDEETLKGTQFIRGIYGQTDTRLQFGVNDMVATEVTLNPMLYTINDPVHLPEGEVFPQVPPDYEEEIPPDPSDERVVDGPENPDEGES